MRLGILSLPGCRRTSDEFWQTHRGKTFQSYDCVFDESELVLQVRQLFFELAGFKAAAFIQLFPDRKNHELGITGCEGMGHMFQSGNGVRKGTEKVRNFKRSYLKWAWAAVTESKEMLSAGLEPGWIATSAWQLAQLAPRSSMRQGLKITASERVEASIA